MARNEIYIKADPETVFGVLATPGTYAEWVVGSSEIHRSDSAWPDAGSIFEHSQGFWPIRLHDTTQVLESDPPRRLLLEVRARPWMIGEVTFELQAIGDGTRVVMIERPVGGVARIVRNPGLDLLLRLRNAESLRRLANVVQRRAGSGRRTS